MKAVLPAGAVVLAGLLAGSLGACTSGSPRAPDVTRTRTVTGTRTHGPTPPVPVSAGPTTSKAAADCPLVPESTARLDSGMRLGRVTVQRSGGRVVGCRFYAVTHPTAQCGETCFTGEHLPPGSQPAVEIDSQRYTTADGAHNAFVLAAGKGAAPQQFGVATGNTGVCYQTDFWTHDHGHDIACAFSVATTAVVIRTVVEHATLDVEELARDAAKRF